MKRQNLKSTLKTLLAGFCIASGGLAFAGSVTVSGTAGTNPTYIVIPEEYAGKEGKFLALYFKECVAETHSFLLFRHHCYTFFLNLKEENYPPQFIHHLFLL